MFAGTFTLIDPPALIPRKDSVIKRFAVCGSLAAAALTMPALAAEPCRVPRELVRLDAPMPVLAAKFRAERMIRIVAIGSSSTAGIGASDASASYPARLDEELDRRFPTHDFIVSNKGIGGQLAGDMAARFERDVIALAPALVIWQTGVNDALLNIGIEEYRRTLRAGIERLKAAGSDVLLVNMQYFPRSERLLGYRSYVKAMHDVAALTGTPVLRRFSAMQHLVESGQYRVQEMLAPDGFHLNDLSYGCLAHMLAEGIAEQLRSGVESTSAGARPSGL